MAPSLRYVVLALLLASAAILVYRYRGQMERPQAQVAEVHREPILIPGVMEPEEMRVEPFPVFVPTEPERMLGEAMKEIRGNSDPNACAIASSQSHSCQIPRLRRRLYGNGSSISRYRKGLILKAGWAETRRQSVLAEKCSPPNRRRLFWRVSFLLVSFAALVFGKGDHIPFIAFPFDFSEIGAASALVGVFLTVDAVRWNILKYPLRFEQWQNSYWCVRCSRVSIIERVD